MEEATQPTVEAKKKRSWFSRHPIIVCLILTGVALFGCMQPIATVNTKPVFNVPALLGKNIDEVRAQLGKGTKTDDPSKTQLPKTSVWTNSFEKGEVTLVVTYDPKTRIVKKIAYNEEFISAAAQETVLDANDYNDHLLLLGNLPEGRRSVFERIGSFYDRAGRAYEFKLIPDDTNTAITGVEVVPS